MSMISGLIDELNKSVDEWNASNMFELARMCREAADTITELRDDLQRANAENARLRSELEAVGIAAYLYGRDDLKAENAKLRELVADMYAVIRRNNSWWDWECKDRKRFADRMRELGMEVQP